MLGAITTCIPCQYSKSSALVCGNHNIIFRKFYSHCEYARFNDIHCVLLGMGDEYLCAWFPIDIDREWELMWESQNPTLMWNP